MSYLPFWVEAAAYKTSLVQSFFIEVPVANPVAVVDLEGACGGASPLKFAKHMLYNVN
jgi:hypothetical protein